MWKRLSFAIDIRLEYYVSESFSDYPTAVATNTNNLGASELGPVCRACQYPNATWVRFDDKWSNTLVRSWLIDKHINQYVALESHRITTSSARGSSMFVCTPTPCHSRVHGALVQKAVVASPFMFVSRIYKWPVFTIS